MKLGQLAVLGWALASKRVRSNRRVRIVLLGIVGVVYGGAKVVDLRIVNRWIVKRLLNLRHYYDFEG